MNKNIWVDCGSQEVARRILAGRGAGSYEVCEFDQNTYIYNGSAETEGTMKNGEPVGTYDVSGTAITKAPTFKLVATGDFTLDANDVQNKQQTGDPRWFAEEEATGIVNVNANVNDSQDAPAYNLAGQRVNANTAKGISRSARERQYRQGHHHQERTEVREVNLVSRFRFQDSRLRIKPDCLQMSKANKLET